MVYIITSLSLFLAAVVLHIVWCRLRKIRYVAIISFLVITLTLLGIYGIVLAFFPTIFSCPQEAEFGLWCLPLKIVSGALYVLLISAYIVFYHGATIESPTRKILKTLERQGQSTYQDLLQATKSEAFVKTRLDEMVVHKCVSFDGQRYRLMPHGKKVAAVLDIYQMISGRAKGG